MCTDIFGANLYNNYLQRRHQDRQTSAMRDLQGSRSIDNLVGAVNELSGASVCHSVLVETGERSGVSCDGQTGNCHFVRGLLSVYFLLTMTKAERTSRVLHSCSSDILIRSFCLLVNAFIAGVFRPDGGQVTSLEHSPRDFLPVEKSYQEPTLSTSNVLRAVQTIFSKEGLPVG